MKRPTKDAILEVLQDVVENAHEALRHAENGEWSSAENDAQTVRYLAMDAEKMLKLKDALRRQRSRAMSERTMVCPFCGHTAITRSIGAIHCGPHKASDSQWYDAEHCADPDKLFPACPMREVTP